MVHPQCGDFFTVCLSLSLFLSLSLSLSLFKKPPPRPVVQRVPRGASGGEGVPVVAEGGRIQEGTSGSVRFRKKEREREREIDRERERERLKK